MRIFVALTLLSLFTGIVDAIRINEIMYNPNGTDEGHEWIELYNDREFVYNVEQWNLFENNAKHSLSLLQGSFIIAPSQFAILADDAEQFLLDYPDYGGNLYDTSWQSLSNTGEMLAIMGGEDETVDSINYTADFGNGNGKTLERFSYGWNESNSIGGSPGKENNATMPREDPLPAPLPTPPPPIPIPPPPIPEPQITKKGISLSSNLDDTLFIGVLYNSLFAIENLDHVSGITDNISLVLEYSILLNDTRIKNETLLISGLNERKTSNTGSFKPNQTGIYTILGSITNISVEDPNSSDNTLVTMVFAEDTSLIPCNVSLSVFVNDTFYEEGESIEFDFKTNDTFPFVIEYWVEDLVGDTYKNKVNTTNLNEKSWKTAIDEQDRALFIKGNLSPSCSDVSIEDNSVDYLFIVSGNRVNQKTTTAQTGGSTLEIVEVKDNARFGDDAEIELAIYKGDTRKYAIELWIEDNGKKVSEVTKLKMPGKFSSFEGTLPIQLFDNCEKRLESGDYDVVIEGLGLKDEEEIEIDLKDCDDTSVTSASTQKLIFEVLNTTIKNDDIKTTVRLQNNQNTELEIGLWSYVYRGSKSYSGERESNRENFTLESHEEKLVTLHNAVLISEPGPYKLKVLLNKDLQKTNQDITVDIELNEQKTESSEQPKTAQKSPLQSNLATVSPLPQQPAILYESTTQKAKNTLFIFILVSSVLLNIILILKL